MNILSLVTLCAGIGLFPSIVTAEESKAVFRSSETQVSLLELYTSEGCSSCPPADRWMSNLLVSPHLWRSIVPVAFHVSYWDYLGWRDPFASDKHSQRQRTYATLGKTRVYTPGFFVNGREWRGFFERGILPISPTLKPGVLEVRQFDKHRYVVTFQELESDNKNYRVHAALLGFDLSSQVKGGENRGLNLKHDFVVVSYQDAVLNRENANYNGELQINPPEDVELSRCAIAFWVTAPKNPLPIQATGGFIEEKAWKVYPLQ